MERGRFCLADSQNVVQFRPEYTCAVILQPIHFQKQPPQGVRRIQAYTLVGYGIQTVAATFPQVSCADKTEVAGLRFGAGFIVGVSLFFAFFCEKNFTLILQTASFRFYIRILQYAL